MLTTMVLEVPCGMNEAGERYCRSAGRQRHFRPQAAFEAEGFQMLARFWAPEAVGASKSSRRLLGEAVT